MEYALFGLLFISIAFTCYHFARKYAAHDIVLSVASILAFAIGIALLAVELWR